MNTNTVKPKTQLQLGAEFNQEFANDRETLRYGYGCR
jgi:hypothetical protein